MTPIDPPSEGLGPRAASAGLVQPPPGLLDKLAEARISVQEKHQYFARHDPARRSIYACTGCDARFPDRHGHPAHVADLVDRAAWDAVAEGLGLREALIFGGRRHLVSDPLEPQP